MPLLAALAFLAAPHLKAFRAADRPRAAAPAADPDLATIDAVLLKRAPELGGTLRAQLGAAVAQEAHRAGFDPLLVLAVIDVESDFEDDVISAKGARGLMQIKPSTLQFLAEKEGLKLSGDEVDRDPALRVRLGVRYLKRLLDHFHDLDLALMAYNAGPARLRAALKGDGLEQFQRYPELVRRDFVRFRRGFGLEPDWAVAVRGAERAADE